MPLRLVPDIHRVTHAIGLYLHQGTDLGVSQGEAHILAFLAEAGAPSTVLDVHRALAHRRSTLTSILDRLEAQGFITRTLSEEDRRVLVVRLTRSGATTAKKVLARLEEFEGQVLKSLSKRSAAEFARVLAAIEAAALELTAASMGRQARRRRQK